MTEADQSSSAKSPRSGGSEIVWLVLVMLIAGGLFAGVYFLPMHNAVMPMANNAGALQQKLAEMEGRVKELEAHTAYLDTRVGDLASAPLAPIPQQLPAKIPASDLANVQSDIASLATTVGHLQDEVKQTGATVHAEAQKMLAKIVAYIQLRDTAGTDHGFAKELATMRAAVNGDTNLKEPLDKIGPYAEKGIPTIAGLRQKLTEQSHATDIAIAKAGAQSWWERIVAELRSLVSIRPLHEPGTPNDTLAEMQTALMHDDLASALDKMKNLPQGAQDVLGEWRQQAEARQTINGVLHETAERLVAGVEESTPVKPVKASKPAEPAAAPESDRQEEP